MTLTAEQLTAVTDELTALARAGVPLDGSLLALAADLPGRHGEVSRRIGERLASGEDLARVLEEDASYPPAYRAVVAAGLRTGRLAEAFAAVAEVAQRRQSLRSVVLVALIYPSLTLAVAVLAYAVIAFHVLPGYVAFRADLLPTTVNWHSRLTAFAADHGAWLMTVPLAGLVVLAVWWFRAWRSFAGVGGLPGGRAILRRVHTSLFADTLAMLLQHEVPLPEALRLAGDATGDITLARAAQDGATRTSAGQSLAEGDLAAHCPWLVLLLSGLTAAPLVHALRRFAADEREQAARSAELLATFLPSAVSIIFSGTVVFILGVLALGPWFATLLDLAAPGV